MGKVAARKCGSIVSNFGTGHFLTDARHRSNLDRGHSRRTLAVAQFAAGARCRDFPAVLLKLPAAIQPGHAQHSGGSASRNRSTLCAAVKKLGNRHTKLRLGDCAHVVAGHYGVPAIRQRGGQCLGRAIVVVLGTHQH